MLEPQANPFQDMMDYAQIMAILAGAAKNLADVDQARAGRIAATIELLDGDLKAARDTLKDQERKAQEEGN